MVLRRRWRCPGPIALLRLTKKGFVAAPVRHMAPRVALKKVVMRLMKVRPRFREGEDLFESHMLVSLNSMSRFSSNALPMRMLFCPRQKKR